MSDFLQFQCSLVVQTFYDKTLYIKHTELAGTDVHVTRESFRL